MKNLIDLEAFKLNKVQMNEVVGGVTRQEYCNQLQEMASNPVNKEEWTDYDWDNWSDAYYKHCMKEE